MAAEGSTTRDGVGPWSAAVRARVASKAAVAAGPFAPLQPASTHPIATSPRIPRGNR